MEGSSASVTALNTMLKRQRIDQDPDYNEAAPPDLKRLKFLEESARIDLGEKVKKILTNQFKLEVVRQQSELIDIDESILKVQQNLQVLRYVAARSYYSPRHLVQSMSTIGTSSQSVLHPAIKKHVGKVPLERMHELRKTDDQHVSADQENFAAVPLAIEGLNTLKVPRYIPPKLPDEIVAVPVRGEHRFMKKKLIIGNVSRWIPVAERDDCASHKWMVYVRGSRDEPNISSFVTQVIFFLHPSYAPHDIVRVVSHPFHITRRGWGEFPIRIQVCFKNPLCKPVNIIHNLKLDQSYTGLQTLGAETIVDVMVYNDATVSTSSNRISKTGKKEELDNLAPVESDEAINSECALETETGETLKYKSQEAEDSGLPQIEIPLECYKNEPVEDDAALELKKRSKETGRGDDTLNDDSSLEQYRPPETQRDSTAEGSSLQKQQSVSDRCPPGHVLVDSDHDYFQTSNLVEHGIQNKVSTGLPTVLGKSPAFTGSSLPSTLKALGSGTPSKPAVFVKCLNKNGTLINVPLALLRNAVVIKPQCPSKLGESLVTQPSYSLLRFASIGNAINHQESTVVQQHAQKTLPTSESFPLKSMPPNCLSPNPVVPDPLAQRGRCYPEIDVTIERRSFHQLLEDVQSTEWRCIRDCVRLLAKHLPLIDENATHRSFLPFSAPTLDGFAAWNIGKQRSAEWMRSKLIQQILQSCRFVNRETTWTTKKIMMWCRRQGYSPLSCWPGHGQLIETHGSTSTSRSSPLYAALPITLCAINLEPKLSPCEDDIVVDIELIDSDSFHKPSRTAFLPSRKSLPLEDQDSALTVWIADSIEQFGFKLGSEVHHDSFVPIARLLMSHIWKGFADDLVRRSLRESWSRNNGQKPDIISLSDVFHVFRRRPEFDMFTNLGLGINTNS